MAKTYKVSGNVEKIVCPVICVIDGVEKEYPNGKGVSTGGVENCVL